MALGSIEVVYFYIKHLQGVWALHNTFNVDNMNYMTG